MPIILQFDDFFFKQKVKNSTFVIFDIQNLLGHPVWYKLASLKSNSRLCCLFRSIRLTATWVLSSWLKAMQTMPVDPSPILTKFSRNSLGSLGLTTNCNAFLNCSCDKFAVSSLDTDDAASWETDSGFGLGTSGSGSGEGVMLNFFISWDGIKDSDFAFIGTSLDPEDAGDPWEPE